jgi:Fe-S-cluster containining protein
MVHWRCISGCGACCRLDPALRGEDLDCLDAEQRRTYLSMVGEDGWCIHFDTGSRRCRIYDARPDFCRVENLVALFAGHGASNETPAAMAAAEARPERPGGPSSQAERTDAPLDPEAQALAIGSCRTQIRAEYGGRGRVMKRFEQAIRRTP